MIPVFMAVGAASLYAASSIFVRRGLHGSNPHAGVVFSTIVNAVSMWLLFFLLVPLSFILNWKAVAVFAVAGILAPGFARMLRYASLERMGIARTGPITATSPIISTAIAVFFLGEHLTLAIVLGTLLILGGILVASRKDLDTNREDMIFAFGAAVLVGIALPIRKYGLSLLDSPILVGTVTATIALFIAITLIGFTGNLSKVSYKDRNMKFYLAAGVCTSAAFVLNYYAVSSGNVSTIGPLLQTTAIFALIFSQLFIRHLEGLTKEVWIGTIVVVVGAILVGTG
ncbi:DMT family transporter [Candidatus Woesearchaeota archaeon]|nr:DMT family transporter [Candidatus Woesearchaeota archaeon]